MTTFTWLGHGAWAIETGKHRLLLDPFLNDSPTSPVKAKDVQADFILLSHGHGDHVGDTVAIAQRTGATVIGLYEVCDWVARQGVKNTIGMNIGGGLQQPFGHVKLTIAHHSSTMPDGSPGGAPAGFLLKLDGANIYFACDTALFMEMQLIGAVGLDLAVLPIGDHFTMGPADSIEAIQMLKPLRVAPAHYNTWPPIAQDAQAWAEQVRLQTSAEPLVLQPGESFNL